MKLIRVAVLLFAIAVIASRADETNFTLTVDGVTYSNVIFGTVTPLSVSIRHKTGAASVPLWKLPPDLQQRFGYDPIKAADYRAAQVQLLERRRLLEEQAQEARAKQEAEQQKQAAESLPKKTEETATAPQAPPPDPRQNLGPVVHVTFTSAFGIEQLPDGTYSANLWYSDAQGFENNLFVTFPQAGLNYMQRARVSSVVPNGWVVFGRSYRADVVTAFGVQKTVTAYWLVGTYAGIDGFPHW